MHLAQLGMTDIRVIDFDLEGSLSSSELNAGGVRATWNLAINIEMARSSIEYFASVADEVGYRACGYLWLHSADKGGAALEAQALQSKSGWPVEAWDVSQLRSKVPFIDKTDDLSGAVFSPRDGLINPNLLKNHYRALARKMGVVFDDRTLLREVQYPGVPGQAISVKAERFEKVMSHESKLQVLSERPLDHSDRHSVEYHAQRVINCAGPWAANIAKILGYSVPSYPLRRQVCIFDCRDVDLTPYGMIVDPSGVYFHPEATNGLAGYATPGEAHGVNYSYDGENFFNERIWPALYERSSSFERLKHLTGWAGLYEVSPDECAILGPVADKNTKKFENIFEAHSFSGHGVMHSYSAGLALAEKIVKGQYLSMDASPLSAIRFETGALIHENLII